jgi:zinc/manganese transport system permease protein
MIAPFLEHEFMRTAFFALLVIAVMFAPLSLFMVARRMSMMGDALSHALLPGVVGAALLGLPLMLGGLTAGFLIALLTPLLARLNKTHDDVAFAFISMLSLALGVALLPASGLDLTHVLFGAILTLETLTPLIVAAILLSILLVFTYKKLVLDTIDPLFLRVQSRFAFLWSMVFLMLMTLALTASFQAIGTLLTVGLLLLPHLTARIFAKTARGQMILSAAVLIFSGYCGLLLSFHANFLPTPAILLACALIYLLSLILKGCLTWKK